MSKRKKITVFPVLFRDDMIQQLYENIEYFDLKILLKESSKIKPYKHYSFRLIPEYFKLHLRNPSLKTKVIAQHNWGYSILLNNANSMDGFMQKQFNSKKRNIFTRYVKRLESCFNVKYRMFYGKISESDYGFIMQALYNMILARFKERNELHKNLHEWNELHANTYQEIVNKKASLFVIYDEDRPIEISLNYHFDKILFSYISSYDISYSKFGLGHVEIYKQIEWCINNNYILFEMGVGGMDYKRRWSNNIYQFKHYIVYNKPTIKVKLLILKFQLKEYLKSKKLNEVSLRLVGKTKKQVETTNNAECKEITKKENTIKTDFSEIEFTNKTYNFLNKYVHDFLYTTENHKSDLKVFKKSNQNTFMLEGKGHYQIISFS
ncbi:GNAT family N-acetyltransferase [Sabulilitoribacter multivorans]|uniref:GNAT family N-acetyltransferase n=1 Tax=Flaviramulus multivorans TaxID=1304750 RepID=A0ABS9IJN2_9FLAO|nr:GNAT family N-acetyltransferase [Flaviramulus multivorans]MCF7560797.1 GNAT family N-acetyltransferase [Flaviramulus multivorans]